MAQKEKENETNESLKKKDDVICIGLDVGTMNICAARSDKDDVAIQRNVFIKLNSDDVHISDLSEINYVQNDDDLYIMGKDAFTYGNIFGEKVSRPMEKGLISPKEISAIDVLTLMIRELIGDVKNKSCYCTFSCPAEAIDDQRSVIYHRNVLSKILNNLGINYNSLNEAMAIIYSECAKEKFTGATLSFGAGMMNCVVSYKGVQALEFSTSRSGDWIDQQTAESLGMISNRVVSIKEKYMKLSGQVDVKNKKTKRVLEALYYYYKSMIEYTIKKIIKEFEEKIDLEIDEEIPIVIAGGTSSPDGFTELFQDILSGYELPFDVSEVRRSKTPLTSVANGLLIKTMADVKSMT